MRGRPMASAAPMPSGTTSTGRTAHIEHAAGLERFLRYTGRTTLDLASDSVAVTLVLYNDLVSEREKLRRLMAERPAWEHAQLRANQMDEIHRVEGAWVHARNKTFEEVDDHWHNMSVLSWGLSKFGNELRNEAFKPSYELARGWTCYLMNVQQQFMETPVMLGAVAPQDRYNEYIDYWVKHLSLQDTRAEPAAPAPDVEEEATSSAAAQQERDVSSQPERDVSGRQDRDDPAPTAGTTTAPPSDAAPPPASSRPDPAVEEDARRYQEFHEQEEERLRKIQEEILRQAAAKA